MLVVTSSRRESVAAAFTLPAGTRKAAPNSSTVAAAAPWVCKTPKMRLAKVVTFAASPATLARFGGRVLGLASSSGLSHQFSSSSVF